MDIVKIKEWVRAFAEKHKLWFECYDEIVHDIPIEDMQTSFINRTKYIEINRFHDITLGFFEFIREDIDEEEWTSVDQHRIFVLQSSDFATEEALFAAIEKETKKYIGTDPK
jgi:hypothetical protein